MNEKSPFSHMSTVELKRMQTEIILLAMDSSFLREITEEIARREKLIRSNDLRLKRATFTKEYP